MYLREQLEKREHILLAEEATKADETKGRQVEETLDELRTEFQRDRDRIIHSKSFRRLMHKTQVFLAPEGDHFRTRLTHTLEVAQISRTIARALNLNEDLTEAIALGHDLGHTPFGHNGEEILNQVHKDGFKHNEQSLRVVDLLEPAKDRRGMNLTFEVRDGILNHSGDNNPSTLEGQIVRISDRIAYINHDIDDAIRSGVIRGEDLPFYCIQTLGNSHRSRIDSMVKNLISSSQDLKSIRMTEEFAKATDELRKFMFKNVYKNPQVKKDEDLARVDQIIEGLYHYYFTNPEALPKEFYNIAKLEGPDVAAKDYVACMTDRFAINMFNDLFVSKAWK